MVRCLEGTLGFRGDRTSIGVVVSVAGMLGVSETIAQLEKIAIVQSRVLFVEQVLIDSSHVSCVSPCYQLRERFETTTNGSRSASCR